MYGKYHASAFTGSMRGSGAVVFAVWGYIIANTNQHSVIELNSDIVAFLLGCNPAEVEDAIEKLCAEDPKSRSKDFDGRRLVKEGEYQYFVPTHKKYREIKTSEEKREYNRVKQQESRLKRGLVKPRVKNVNDVNTTEEEEEAKTDEEKIRVATTKPASPCWSSQEGFMNISDEIIDSWEKAYPACNINRQLAAMNEWLLSNPAKAKKSQWRSFISKWLGRAQERGGDIQSNRPSTQGPPSFI